jgi:excisionase family DNA binding protein
MGAQTTTYLTVADVAEKLAISELTVRRRIASGEIPAVRLSRHRRGAVRIPEDGLDAWLRSVRQPSNGPDAA